MRSLIVSICLAMSAPAMAGQTIIIPISDVVMSIPNFDNAPQFNMNSAIYGNMPFGSPSTGRRETRREREQRLIELVQDMYPDATVRIHNGNLIVRLP